MTTISMADFTLSPAITLGQADHRQLIVLAMAGLGQTAEDADGLLYELERAQVVPDSAVPDDVVRMGSFVRFRTNAGGERQVELVYPADADIEAGKVSVLTPVGTALLGLRAGQSITWLTRDGRKQLLTVLGVRQPDGDSEPTGPAAA
jgi:regulator of nucleoside diphosphate kinase